jgi:hypothetical protein
MSLWLDSLSQCLENYKITSDTNSHLKNSVLEKRALCIFEYLSMDVPRSWWERCLEDISIRDGYTRIVIDLLKELKRLPDLHNRVTEDVLIAMAFIDKSKLPEVSISNWSIEEYIRAAEEALIELPQLRSIMSS